MEVDYINDKPLSLPLGFAQQVMDLQIKLENQESLELIQILSKMYRIAVQFYIDADVQKAMYFQKKLNKLALKSLNADSVQSTKPKKTQLPKTINEQINKYKLCEQTYLKSLVQNNQKIQKKIVSHVHEDIRRQEDKLQGRRMLRRVKSQERLKLR